MPREIVKKPRMIYPQIATSLSIARLSVLAELLFWRLLPQADDQGRLPGDPLQLKATVCPIRKELTEENIPDLLAELEKAEIIICYSNSSTSYIQIAKWWEYQGAMRRIFPSQYPPPNGWQDIVKDVSGGQPPTTADDVRPKKEPEKELEKGIHKTLPNGKVRQKQADEVKELFDLWNSLGLIKHRKLTGDMTRAIKATSRDFSAAEISQAMRNYAHIVNDEQCYFKYRWTLKDFLKRGLEKFLDLEVALRNYHKDAIKTDERPRKAGRVPSKTDLDEQERRYFGER